MIQCSTNKMANLVLFADNTLLLQVVMKSVTHFISHISQIRFFRRDMKIYLFINDKIMVKILWFEVCKKTKLQAGKIFKPLKL